MDKFEEEEVNVVDKFEEEVNAVIFETTEELIGYIGQWLDEDPYFQPSDAVAVIDAIKSNIMQYLHIDKETGRQRYTKAV